MDMPQTTTTEYMHESMKKALKPVFNKMPHSKGEEPRRLLGKSASLVAFCCMNFKRRGPMVIVILTSKSRTSGLDSMMLLIM